MADNAVRVGVVLSATDRMSRVIDAATKKAEARLKGFTGAASKISGTWSLLAGAGMVAGIKEATDAAGGAAIADKRLAREMQNMWGNNKAVNQTVEKMKEMAEVISKQTGIDKESIKLTMAKAASFAELSNKTYVQSKMFERTVKAAHDLEALDFGNSANNIVQLAKAVTDPFKMAGALRKAGTITPADLEKIYATIKKSGKAAGIEEMMQAIERQSLGMAEATAGAGKKMALAWHEVNVEFGKAFLPSMKNGKMASTSFANGLAELISKHRALTRTIAYTTLGIIGVGLAIKAVISIASAYKDAAIFMRVMTTALSSSFDTLRLRIWYSQAAIAKMGIAQKIATAWQWIWNASMYACPIVWIIAAVIAAVGAVTLLVVKWKEITKWWKESSTALKILLGPLLISLGPIIAIAYAIRKLIDCWPQIVAFFDGIGAKVAGLAKSFVGFGKSIMVGLYEGIKSMIMKPIELIQKVADAIKNKFKSIFGIHSPSKLFAEYGVNITAGLSKGIEKGTPQTAKSTEMMGRAAKSGFNNSTGKSPGGGVTISYNPTINIGSASEADRSSLMAELKKHKRELFQMFRDEMQNNARLSFS